MQILDAVAVELSCNVCGGHFAVTLRQIRLAQAIVHEGCFAPQGEAECMPAAFAGLLDHQVLDALEETWQSLEDRVRAAGGIIALQPEPAAIP
ncbi:MAG TPA: hypothetical protein VIU62_01630 [Chloroflexota bacterium]|jgi:hypothetical protein